MKKIIFLNIIFFLIFLSMDIYAQPPSPTATGTPSIYWVTIKKFRVYDGTNWITVKEEDVSFDIASATAGQAVGNFFSGSFTPGTYTMIEVTPSATFSMRGYIIDAVGTTDYYTSTTGANGMNSTTSFNVNNPPSDYGEGGITVYGYTQGAALAANQENVNIVVERGVSKKVKVQFNVANTLALYDVGGGSYQLMPAQPTVTQTIE